MLSEALTLLEFLFFASAVILSFRFAGLTGLYLFSALGVVVANIQVLREAQFMFQQAPVALGTVVFSMTFLVTDIITEHFGPSAAKKSIVFGFWAQIMFTFATWIILLYQPQTDDNFRALYNVFGPMPRILVASLIAFVFSQLLDIFIFEKVKKILPGKRMAGVRSFLSTLAGGSLDNLIFSTLAWNIFSPSPYPMSKIIYTYVLGTLLFRIFVSLWTTPLIYVTHMLKKHQ